MQWPTLRSSSWLFLPALPWSRFGDGAGPNDNRAKCLEGVLRVIVRTPPVCVVLENVWACWQDTEVLQAMQQVCKILDWTYKLIKLHL